MYLRHPSSQRTSDRIPLPASTRAHFDLLFRDTRALGVGWELTVGFDARGESIKLVNNRTLEGIIEDVPLLGIHSPNKHPQPPLPSHLQKRPDTATFPDRRHQTHHANTGETKYCWATAMSHEPGMERVRWEDM